MRQRYDAIVVGTGFAASFFLHRFLERSGPGVRVLVLERGRRWTHAEQKGEGRTRMVGFSARTLRNRTPEKEWNYLHAFGGGSNCWYACAPRMQPDDFRLRSRFGVGADWPVGYDELEPYYADAEDILQVAGDSANPPSPRSRPYPQPPHRMNAVDRMFKEAFPGELFVQPCARPSRNTANRPACCGNATCHYCPTDAKFTIQNELAALYEDPRVELRLDSWVQGVETTGGVATGVRYTDADDADRVAEGDLVVLGANALSNPHILLRSGFTDAELGRGLGEQVGTEVILHLDGVDNFGGGTWVIGHWYGLHGAERRRDRAAALIEIGNAPKLHDERGKWRQIAFLRVIFEDLRRADNVVRVDAADPRRHEVSYAGHSDYAQRGVDRLIPDLERKLAGLPIERMFVSPDVWPTESHIQGSVVMGNDPRTSVVDRYGAHHRVRNLLVLGSSMFPTSAPANPTLTICALALRAADHVGGAPKSLFART